MKSVFETSLGIEAHMIKNVLSMNELESEIFGEHLQGGVGELQAGGIIRVMVSDENYPEAHKIIKDWETAQSTPEPDYETKAVARFGSGLLGFILGAIVIAILMKSPISVDGIDYDGDGTLDEQWQYSGRYLQWMKLDQNRDGEFDIVWNYDTAGFLWATLMDTDFDSRHETNCRFKEGNTIWCHSDFDNDGFAEYREDYRFGILSMVSMFDADTKLVKKKQFFEGGRLKRAKLDSNGDGVFETQYEYDEFEESK